MVEASPLPDASAMVVEDEDHFLVIADYHAGLEASLRHEEGVELRSRGPERRERLLGLVDRVDADELVMLGDVTHSIGAPDGAERGELEVLFSDLDLPVTVAKGNHDGAIETLVETDPDTFGNVTITPGEGARRGAVGIAHGHTWPSVDVLGADLLCIGHEHPSVRLVDAVGGVREERAWLRGRLVDEPFEAFHERSIAEVPELVVVPAFNELCGGTWVNDPDCEYLAPFLPAGLAEPEVHLLDGTYLGPPTDIAS